MIKLENVNKIIKQLGGEEIDLELLKFLQVEILQYLKEACYRDTFPEEAIIDIERLIAINAILHNMEMKDLLDSKEPIGDVKRIAKSVNIENTKVDFDYQDKEAINREKENKYRNKLNDLFYSRLEIFCSRYRCLKC